MSSRFEISSINRGLFNRDLLANYVDDDVRAKARAIKSHFEEDNGKNPLRLSPRQLAALSEDDTIDYYINPILESLGYRYRRKLKDTESRFPDIWLFNEEPEETSATYLQKYNLSVLEAKKYKVNLDVGDSREEKPPMQLASYIESNLKFNERKRWGILSNGYKWRLYSSDGIDKYIEFDIDHALENPDELNLFCLIFSPQSFKINKERTDLLSQLQKASLDSWVVVTSEIEERGNKVLLNLVNGFYESVKDLDKAKESAYATLFRLLYILYIESKHLIPRSGVRYYEKSLRSLLHDIHETTLEEYEISRRLNALFKMYRNGEGILPDGYGGEHFEQPLKVEIENRWLKTALDLLTVFEAEGNAVKFFDYSSLNVELIGNIYEGTLGLVFDEKGGKVAIKKIQKKKGTEVHSTGTTYTPPNVVKYLIESTIPAELERIPSVCDPACGSGHFLIQSLRHLAKAIDFTVTESQTLQEHKRKIARNGLFGADINPLATQLARLMLVIETAESGKAPENFRNNIQIFNALTTKWKSEPTWLKKFGAEDLEKRGGFDFVVGNPPYVRADEPGESEKRDAVVKSEQYSWLYKKWDLFVPFIELAYGLVERTNGKVAFVVSDGITYAPYSAKCVESLVASHHIEFVSHFSDSFPGWAFPATCFSLNRAKKHPLSERRVHVGNDPLQIESKESVSNPFSNSDKERVDELLSGWSGFCLGDLCYVSVGMVLNSNEKLKNVPKFKKDDLISLRIDKNHPVRFIDNEDLGPGKFKKGIKQRYIEYGPSLRAPKFVRRPTFPELHAGKRILVSSSKNESMAVATSSDIVVSHNTIVLKAWSELIGIDNRQISMKASLSKKVDWLVLPKEIGPRLILEEASDYCSDKLVLGILMSETFKRWIRMDKRHKHVMVPDVLSELPVPISGRKLTKLKKETFGLKFGSIVSKLEKMDSASAESPIVSYIEDIVVELTSKPVGEKKAAVLKGYLDKLVELFYRPVMQAQGDYFSVSEAAKRIVSNSENESIKELIVKAKELLRISEEKEKQTKRGRRAS